MHIGNELKLNRIQLSEHHISRKKKIKAIGIVKIPLQAPRAKNISYKFKWHTGNELKLNRIRISEHHISSKILIIAIKAIDSTSSNTTVSNRSTQQSRAVEICCK